MWDAEKKTHKLARNFVETIQVLFEEEMGFMVHSFSVRRALGHPNNFV